MKYFQVKCLTSLQNKVINNFFPTNKQLIKSPLVQTFSYCFRFNYNSTATWVDTKTQNYAFWIVIIKKGQSFIFSSASTSSFLSIRIVLVELCYRSKKCLHVQKIIKSYSQNTEIMAMAIQSH